MRATRKLLLLLLLLAGFSPAALAVDQTPLNLPGKIQVDASTEYLGVFTATQDCTFEVSGTGKDELTWFTTFVEPWHSSNMAVDPDTWGYLKDIRTIHAGTTYYIYCSSWSAIDVDVVDPDAAGGATLGLISVEPAQNTVFGSGTNGSTITLTMDADATFTSYYVTCGSLYSQTYGNTNGQIFYNVAIWVQKGVQELFSLGATTGSTFQIHIQGLSTGGSSPVLYNGDGNLTLTYTLGSEGLDVVEAECTLKSGVDNLLYSYIPSGDAEGIIVFKFNKPFDPTVTASYEYTLPDASTGFKNLTGPFLDFTSVSTSGGVKMAYQGVFSEDNTVATFDISGTNWHDCAGTVKVEKGVKNVPSLTLRNAKDPEGGSAMGTAQANAGSYCYSTDYRIWNTATMNTSWSPASGSSLTAGQEVTFNVTPVDEATGNFAPMRADRITGIQGLKFTYTEDEVEHTQTLPCTATKQPDGKSWKAVVAVPAAIATKSNLKVAADGVTTRDAQYYDFDDNFANYNPAKVEIPFELTPDPDVSLTSISTIVVATPAEWEYGSSRLEFPNSQDNTNINWASEGSAANGYKTYTISLNPPLSLDGSSGIQVADGSQLKLIIPANTISYLGGKNEAMEIVWTLSETPVDPDPVDVEITLASPVVASGLEQTTMADEWVFNVVGNPLPAYLRYDLVDSNSTNIYGAEITYDEANSQWSAYCMPYRYMDGVTYTMTIRGYDSEDAYIEGTAEPTYTTTVVFAGLAQPLQVNTTATCTPSPASGSLLETSQASITFTFSEAVTIENARINLPKKGEVSQDPLPVSLVGSNGNTVWTLNIATSGFDMTAYVWMGIYFQAFDSEGAILAGNYGSEENSAFSFEYEINSGADIQPVTVTPAFGTVTSISDIALTVPAGFEASFSWNSSATLVNTATDSPVTLNTKLDDNDFRKVHLVPAAEVTEPGSYRLTVPKGYLVINNAAFEEYKNDLITGIFTIEDNGEIDPAKVTVDINVMPNGQENLTSIKTIQISVDSANDVTALTYGADPSKRITLTGPDDTVYVIPASVSSSIRYTFATPLTASGDYTLHIPYAFFTVGSAPSNYTKELTLTLTVEEIIEAGTFEVQSNLPDNTAPAALSVQQIDYVMITFPGIEKAEVNFDAEYQAIHLYEHKYSISDVKDNNGLAKATWYTYSISSALEYNKFNWYGYYDDEKISIKKGFQLELDNIVNEEGLYNLYIPEKIFQIPVSTPSSLRGTRADSGTSYRYNEETNMVISVDNTNGVTTGLNTIVVEKAQRYVVHTLQGVKVLDTVNPAEMHRLNPGLYIVNGVKTMIGR